MQARLVRLVLFLLLGLAQQLCMGQGDTIPNGSIALRSFDEAQLEAYKADPALNYERELHSGPTPWERFKEWLANWLQNTFGTVLGAVISENVILILSIIVLVLAAMMLGRGGIRRIFQGSPRAQAEVLSGTEDIREMDLPGLIAEAERAGDLRRAIRLHYLMVLKRSVDSGLLTWSPDFTDHDYVAQLKDTRVRERFSRLSSIFQWIWYGDSPISAERYAMLRKPFMEFEVGPSA